MLRRLDDLLISMLIAALALTLTLAGVDNVALRALVGIPLIVILPGYVGMELLFAPNRFGLGERLLITLGLSLGIVILIGLGLNATPWGIQPASVALALSGYTIVVGGLAAVRRLHTAAGATTAAPSAVSVRQWTFLLVAALVLGAVAGLARVPASQSGLQGYTTLWIVPDQNTPSPSVRMGVTSMEFSPVVYKLTLTADGAVIGDWPEIELQPGDKWEQVATLPTTFAGSSAVEALLYRLDRPETVYRRVLLNRGSK